MVVRRPLHSKLGRADHVVRSFGVVSEEHNLSGLGKCVSDKSLSMGSACRCCCRLAHSCHANPDRQSAAGTKLACPFHLLLPVRFAAIDLGMPAQIGFGRTVDRLGWDCRRAVRRKPARRGDDGFLGHAGDIGRHEHALLAMLEHRLPFEFGVQRGVVNAALTQSSRESIDVGGWGVTDPCRQQCTRGDQSDLVARYDRLGGEQPGNGLLHGLERHLDPASVRASARGAGVAAA